MLKRAPRDPSAAVRSGGAAAGEKHAITGRSVPEHPLFRRFGVLTKKLHIYLGLLNFSIVLVFGIAGLTASIDESWPGQRAPIVEDRAFRAPAGLRDVQIGDLVYAAVRPPLVTPRKYPVYRNARKELIVDFYSVNGTQHITHLASENKLRVETRRNTFSQFLDRLHATTGNPSDPRLRLWACYVEFSIWSLLAMVLTGLYLWASARWRFRWARISFAAGTALVAALWTMFR